MFKGLTCQKSKELRSSCQGRSPYLSLLNCFVPSVVWILEVCILFWFSLPQVTLSFLALSTIVLF